MMKLSKKNSGLILLPLFIAVSIIGGIFIGRYISQRNLSVKEEKLRTILQLIKTEYVDELDIDSLIEAGLPDLLSSLDPHSAYIPASELISVNEDLQGSFSGVGISFQIVEDTVFVVEVIAGGPAEKVGILPGDRILMADDVVLTGKDVSTDSVFKNLRGEKGSTVRLKVKRHNSSKESYFDVVRGDIPVNSVDVSYMVSEDTGYVRVIKFSRNTYREFLSA